MSHSALGPHGTLFLLFSAITALYAGYLHGIGLCIATLFFVYMSLVLAKIYFE